MTRRTAIALLLLCLVEVGTAQLTAPETARESYRDVSVTYSSVQAPDGSWVRLIITRPKSAPAKSPAIFLAGWLSCDSVEIPKVANGSDYVLHRLITDSQMVVVRMDKQGMGDSQGGPCKELDFERELGAYRAAFQFTQKLSYVDAQRIYILGMSNGGGFAPLVAESAPVAGYIVSGGWAKTWFEHMMYHERLRLTLSGKSPAEVTSAMRGLTDFHAIYLNQKKTPAEVIALRPELRPLWYDEPGHQYGRPARFYHQLQDLNLAEAWSKVSAPTLAIHGEYDWIMDPEDHEMIVALVNRNRAGAGKFVSIPGMDHFYKRHESMQASFSVRGSYVDEVAEEILDWIRSQH